MTDTPPEVAAASHLEQVHGARGLHAAILAMLVPPASPAAARAWDNEVAGTGGTAALLAHVRHLPGPARLRWFETLVSRMRAQPLEARQDLLEATRRLMAASGTVRPIDRLHWLAMRQRLGGSPGNHARAAAAAELSQLPQSEVDSIASYTAFLSRLVPLDAVAIGADGSAGTAWYDTALQPWRAHATVAPCRPPDTDGLVHALQELQSMAWMQRPMLVRAWLIAALQHSPHGRLADSAADALRLTCALLDSPLPPELARHYGTTRLDIPR